MFAAHSGTTFNGLVAAGEKLHPRFLLLAQELHNGLKARYPA
jgi:hypothetical protein